MKCHCPSGRRSFPQFLPPPFPYNKWKFSHLKFFYLYVFRHQLWLYYLRTVRPFVCGVLTNHGGKTYVDADWTYTVLKCSRCHMTLRDLRKNP